MTPAERVQALLFGAYDNLPPRVKRLMAGPPHVVDGNTLDVDAQVVVRINKLNPRPPVEERGAEAGRDDLVTTCRMVAGRRIEVERVEDTTIAGLRARLYTPKGHEPDALLLFFHGGGWVVGDLETHDAPCRALANAAGLRVLAVDYDRAPENPFPGPVDQAVAAFEQAKSLARHVAVGGDSAGGNLAAMVAQRGDPFFQLLIYPATDFVDEYESERLFRDGYLLTKKNMDWYEAQYAPNAEQKHAASPLRSADLGGLAPAMVVTAGFDPLRDEGELYARRLQEAGVQVLLRRHPGQVHGFLNMTALRSTREAIAEMGGVLRAAVAAKAQEHAELHV